MCCSFGTEHFVEGSLGPGRRHFSPHILVEDSSIPKSRQVVRSTLVQRQGRMPSQGSLTNSPRSSPSPRRQTAKTGHGKGNRAPPTCALCRNHGIVVRSKSHKKECPFQRCFCPRCGLTSRRRMVMKMQVSLRRSQDSEFERQRKAVARIQNSGNSSSEDADTSLSSESSESSTSDFGMSRGLNMSIADVVDPLRTPISQQTADIAAELVKLFPPSPNSPAYIQMQPFFDSISGFVERLSPAYMQAFLAHLGSSATTPVIHSSFAPMSTPQRPQRIGPNQSEPLSRNDSPGAPWHVGRHGVSPGQGQLTPTRKDASSTSTADHQGMAAADSSDYHVNETVDHQKANEEGDAVSALVNLSSNASENPDVPSTSITAASAYQERDSEIFAPPAHQVNDQEC